MDVPTFNINELAEEKIASSPERDAARQMAIEQMQRNIGGTFIPVQERQIPFLPGWSLISRSPKEKNCLLWKHDENNVDGCVAIPEESFATEEGNRLLLEKICIMEAQIYEKKKLKQQVVERVRKRLRNIMLGALGGVILILAIPLMRNIEKSGKKPELPAQKRVQKEEITLDKAMVARCRVNGIHLEIRRNHLGKILDYRTEENMRMGTIQLTSDIKKIEVEEVYGEAFYLKIYRENGGTDVVDDIFLGMKK